MSRSDSMTINERKRDTRRGKADERTGARTEHKRERRDRIPIERKRRSDIDRKVLNESLFIVDQLNIEI